jgi:hypothetical protein
MTSTSDLGQSRRDEFGEMLVELGQQEESMDVIKRYVNEHGGVDAIKADLDRPYIATAANDAGHGQANTTLTSPPQTEECADMVDHISHPALPPRRPADVLRKLFIPSAVHSPSSAARSQPSRSHSEKSSNSKDSRGTGTGKRFSLKSRRKQYDIGSPTDVRHVSHIGYGANSSWEFVNADPEMRKLLEQIGVVPLYDEVCDDEAFESGSTTTSLTSSTSAAPDSSSLSEEEGSNMPPSPPLPPPLPEVFPSRPQLPLDGTAGNRAATNANDRTSSSSSSNAQRSPEPGDRICPDASAAASASARKLSARHSVCSAALSRRQLENTSSLSGVTTQTFFMSILDLPICWAPMSTSELYRLVDIAPDDSEYIKVKQLAESTANEKLHQVVKIQRIQNVNVYKQYMTRKLLMDKLQPNIVNERRLWHGTDTVAMDNMIRGGFNRSYCGKNAAKFGKGVYFAVEFQYAAQSTYSPPDTSGYQHVFLSRVLVGEFTQGNESLLEPPLKPDNIVRYDSVVDNPNLPKIFVIFHDAQAFPEYCVTFF